MLGWGIIYVARGWPRVKKRNLVGKEGWSFVPGSTVLWSGPAAVLQLLQDKPNVRQLTVL